MEWRTQIQGYTTIHWGKDSIFHQQCWEDWISPCRTTKLDPYLSPSTKVNFKWAKNLIISTETARRKTGERASKHWKLRSHHSRKKKQSSHPRMRAHGIKRLLFCKEHSTEEQVKKQPRGREEHSIYLSSIEYVSRIYNSSKIKHEENKSNK